jgi:formylglycine-generating enzyme required for sulfatase activity
MERLLTSQFESVVFRTKIPIEYLPGAGASRTERAIAVIRYFEQQDQLDQLARIVHQVVIAGEQAGSRPATPSVSPDPTGIGDGAESRDGRHDHVRRFVMGFVVFVGAAFTAVLIAHGLRCDTPRPPVDDPTHVVAAGPPDAQAIPDGSPSPDPAGSLAPSPVRDCPADMVRVPAGTFWMGSPSWVGDADEHPTHEVALSAYCIDRTEVTVKTYANCVRTRRCTTVPLTLQHSRASAEDFKPHIQSCNGADRPSHPINCVDWNQASTYCAWAGKRLPTEAEWEYAARGTDGREYPWGNDLPRETQLNACGGECVEMARREGLRWSRMLYKGTDGWATTAPVGSFSAGASPFGALDMAGNVWEWTADPYGLYPVTAAVSPRGERTGLRVVRGGAWTSKLASEVRATNRRWLEPSRWDGNLGFRCARGAP